MSFNIKDLNFKIYFLIFTLSLMIFSSFLFSKDYTSLDKKQIIENLLDKLEEADDITMSKELKKKIWFFWNNSFVKVDVGNKFFLSMQYLEKGDLKNSELLLNKIIEIEPFFLEARNKRALLKFLKKDFDGSKEDILFVLNFQRRHFGAIHGLALIYLEKKKYKKAFEQFKILNKIDPMNNKNKEILFYLKKNYLGESI